MSRPTGEDPADLTNDALKLSLGSDERAYQSKLPTVKRYRARGFTDQQIEQLLQIKLKPEHRHPNG